MKKATTTIHALKIGPPEPEGKRLKFDENKFGFGLTFELRIFIPIKFLKYSEEE